MFQLDKLTTMKKTIILTAACIVAMVAVAQQLASHSKALPNTSFEPAFNWSKTEHSFGTIKIGEPVSHEFIFTNSGKEALLITSVSASCGCTVTEYSKEPISAGGKGFVKATYNAAKIGMFSKTVTIKANTREDTIVLTITGEVIE